MEETLMLPVAIDYVVLFAIFALAALYTLKRDRGVVPALAIALPLSFFAFDFAKTSVFFADFISSIEPQPLTMLAAHGVFLFVFYIFLRTLYPTYGERGQPIQSLLVSTALVIIMLVIWSTTPFISEIRALSAFFAEYFASQYLFFWLIGSFGLLYFAASR